MPSSCQGGGFFRDKTIRLHPAPPWPGRQSNLGNLGTHRTNMPGGMQPSTNLASRMHRPMNRRRSYGMVREVFNNLCRAIRRAPGGKEQEPHKRKQANSESNTQKKAKKLSDRLHGYPFQITTALRCHLGTNFVMISELLGHNDRA